MATQKTQKHEGPRAMKQAKKSINTDAQAPRPLDKSDVRQIASEGEQARFAPKLLPSGKGDGIYVRGTGQRYEVAGVNADLVEAAILALNNDCGGPTPIEEFINSILLDYHLGILTFERVGTEYEDLKRGMERLKDNLEVQARLYPAFLSQALERAEEQRAAEPTKEAA